MGSALNSDSLTSNLGDFDHHNFFISMSFLNIAPQASFILIITYSSLGYIQCCQLSGIPYV